MSGSGPLAGVRIIDLTGVIAGPYATMWLGDLGADVIKVEAPEGDTTRQAGLARHPAMGSMFLTVGRSKRSIVVDLKAPGGLDVVLELCRDADVLVHNMRPEPIERLGLGYEAVRAVNPAIVHATLTGFGPDGPYRDRPAYDDMIQGMVGFVDAMARVTGEPRYLPGVVVDKTVGLVLLSAILAALFHRERTGAGQAIVVPMFETAAAFQLTEHLWDATFDPPEGPPGYVRVLSAQRRPYRSADGWVCALPYLDKHFRALWAALERPDLAADPRFASIATRLTHIDAVCDTLAALIAEHPSAWWIELFGRIGVPAVPMGTIDGLLEDEHLAAVGFFETVQHPQEGRLRLPRSPVAFSSSPPGPHRFAPALGQQSVEVLEELGCSAAQIERWRVSGALGPQQQQQSQQQQQQQREQAQRERGASS